MILVFSGNTDQAGRFVPVIHSLLVFIMAWMFYYCLSFSLFVFRGFFFVTFKYFENSWAGQEPPWSVPGAVIMALSKPAQESSCAALLVMSEGAGTWKPPVFRRDNLGPAVLYLLIFVIVPETASFPFSNSIQGCGPCMSFWSLPLLQVSQRSWLY